MRVMRRTLISKILDPAGANNMTGTAAIVSMAIEAFPYDIDFLSFEVQIAPAGTASGTLTFEGSNQYDPISNPGATFIQINAPTLLNPAVPAIVTGAFATGLPNQYLGSSLRPGMAKWLRWRYVNASGTGQISIWAFGKGKN
jgi:hypothetical protein